MKLSIVIVNYNVKHFLEQCLQSVYNTIGGLECEVFVVDNNSQDGSLEMLREKFPNTIVIANTENVGFSTANNQAINQSKGEYVLLLNPDTVVEENTFSSTLDFMDRHKDAGALGVKMIDGKANYLPESKRGLPTPWVAFYKIFGLASIFPRSKKYARYYLGHLDKEETHEAEILAGAFMLMRKSVLDEVGLLDETFFMYGEDIDLSYRITKAGYKNYYFSDTRIIHYKGESTKKGSLNYVYVFYKAMIIFAEKHFSESYAGFFRLLILMAIYLRAGLSLIRRFIRVITLPLFDFTILLIGLHYIKEYWENNHRFIIGGEYSWELISIAFPVYAITWIAGIFLSGGYEKPTRLSQLLKGLFWGSIAIIVMYSLVSEQYRFSRAILLLGAVWAAIAIPISRLILQKLFGLNLITSTASEKRVLVVGDIMEAQRVEQILKHSVGEVDYIGFIAVNDQVSDHPRFVSSILRLTDIVKDLSIDEVVFCSRDIDYASIFDKMEQLNSLDVEIKIVPVNTDFIIGSNSIDKQGSWYSTYLGRIAKPSNKRAKRIFDVIAALFLMLFSFLIIWFVKDKSNFFKNCFQVLIGRKTWVAYDTTIPVKQLPKLKAGVLKTTNGVDLQKNESHARNHLNQLYAKNYTVYHDLNFLISNLSDTGQH